MSNIKIKMILFLCLIIIYKTVASDHHIVKSPDEKIKFELTFNKGNALYNLSAFGEVVLNNSEMGFVVVNDFEVIGSYESSFDKIWKPIYGQFSEIRNNYNQLKLFLKTNSDIRINLLVRVFNDGVGFRYEFPNQQMDSLLLNDFTTYSFSEDYNIWYPEMNLDWDEPKSLTISDRDDFRTPVSLSISESLYVSLGEADLVNCSPLKLKNVGSNTLAAEISNERTNLPYESPWRTIAISKKPGGLVESQLILNLNDEPVGDFSWVKPGKSFWDWRVRGAKFDDYEYCGHEITTDCCKHYVDKASALGIEYFLLDANWYGSEQTVEANPLTGLPSLDVQELIRYAKTKGVGIWLYINDVAMRNYDQDLILSTYKKWGVAGIKHGFLRGKGIEKVNHAIQILEKCSQYELMYIQHEGFSAAGIQRKYPNYFGAETGWTQMDGCSDKNKANELPPELRNLDYWPVDAIALPCADIIAPPSYHVINPFASQLSGPIDFTPGVFDCNDGTLQGRLKYNAPLPSTINNQIALCNIFHSGILTLMDAPESYEQYPEMFEFIKKLPRSFDFTEVIESEIGKYFIIARQKGNEWFISGITNEAGREININFGFLDDGNYFGKYYSDDKENSYLGEKEKHVILNLSNIKTGSNYLVKMVPGGGFNIYLSKVN